MDKAAIITKSLQSEAAINKAKSEGKNVIVTPFAAALFAATAKIVKQ